MRLAIRWAFGDAHRAARSSRSREVARAPCPRPLLNRQDSFNGHPTKCKDCTRPQQLREPNPRAWQRTSAFGQSGLRGTQLANGPAVASLEKTSLSLAAVLLALLLLGHGALHALGFVKAFALADVPTLQRPISRSLGLLWGAAGVLLALAAALFLSSRSSWGLVAGFGIVASQVAVFTSFSDARFGTVVNLLLAAPVAVALLAAAPNSLASRFRADAALVRGADARPPLLTETDIGDLPEQVQVYLRFVGAIGQPRVLDFRADFRGTIKSKPDGAWMKFEARQLSAFPQNTRLFLLQSSLFGLPFTAYHRYQSAHATMQVKAAELFSVIDATGPEMDQSETVTLLNDLCVLAPAALVGQNITWQTLGPRRVRATFSHGRQRVSAELEFDARGALINFQSQDRYLSVDGKTFAAYRWSTPLSNYRSFGRHQLAARGDASWAMPDGELVYGKFELLDIEYNLATP